MSVPFQLPPDLAAKRDELNDLCDRITDALYAGEDCTDLEDEWMRLLEAFAAECRRRGIAQ